MKKTYETYSSISNASVEGFYEKLMRASSLEYLKRPNAKEGLMKAFDEIFGETVEIKNTQENLR